jgi:hypothetical protein
MTNGSAWTPALALVAWLLLGCADAPQQALFVSGSRDLGPGELDGASVSVDKEVVGTLEPMRPPPWMQWLADKWFGREVDLDNAILDGAFIMTVDLRQFTAGTHTVIVRTPNHTFTRTFRYPDDLEEDGIWITVGHRVNWPWCDVLIPPILDCRHRDAPASAASAVDDETTCVLVQALKNCVNSNDWIGTEAIELCSEDHKAQAFAVFYDHTIAGSASRDEATGKIACSTHP